jgi:regulator of sirC expression with transglutaminase-like and TPR domain
VRVGGAAGMYLDPFNHGHIVEQADLVDLARRLFGEHAELAPGQLEPVPARVIAVRMLFNLQQIYEKRGDHARAFVACDRLVTITDAPFHVRDRGLHALAIGANQVAIDDLESYLARGATAVDIARIKELLDKAKNRAQTEYN